MGIVTDRYRWLGAPPEDRPVVLVAQAPYHLYELYRLADRLSEQSIEAALAIPVVQWKPFHRYRPTVRRLAATAQASKRMPTATIAVPDLLRRSSALVVMNDWGVTRHLVETARSLGVPTFGWVEGVQDYHDLDTRADRRAYQRVDHVFTLGPASNEILGADRSTMTGSERLSDLWDSPALPVGHGVLINSNFTYGVLVKERRPWVKGVVDACTASGQTWTLSRHSAERGRSPYRATEQPIELLLPKVERLVSRFSTVNLDALVLGVELVYHQPHGEREATFACPQGAFDHTTSVEELVEVLRRPARTRQAVRTATAAFLQRLVLLDNSSTPAQRAATVIAGTIC